MGEPKFFKQPWPEYQSDPYVGAFVITPGTTEFTIYTRAIWVGGIGDIIVLTERDEEVIISGVAAGTELRLRAKKLLAVDLNSPANSTTATNLIGLY